MKYITLKLQSGDIYGLPLKLVAKARAEYYVSRDKDTTLQEEMDFVMEDDYEGIDWFFNNQNPEDFRAEFVLLKAAPQTCLMDQIRKSESNGIIEVNSQ
jgi:hypothetical protein